MHADLANTSSLRLTANGGTVRPTWGQGAPGADGSNVLPTDAAMTAIASDPGSDFAAQQSASTDDKVSADIRVPATPIGAAIAATSEAKILPVYHLNAYENFFLSAVGGTQNVFVTSQLTAATTLTAGVSAGASVLPVTSAAGITTGTVLVTGAGTAQQQVHRVLSVASNNVTLTAPVTNTLSNGASIAPLWTNESHLSADAVGGFKAFGYFVANAKDSTGNYIITGTNKTVVWLGDSWAAQSVIQLNTSLDARLGATNVVDAGVGGNTLAAMLARFDTDVTPYIGPGDYVVIEFGVNDVYNAVTSNTIASQLEQVVAKCRAIGAVPIVTGIVPLQVYPAQSGERQTQLKALLLDGHAYPSATAVGADSRYALAKRYNTSSLGVGFEVLQSTSTGDFNTAFGYRALKAVTTGSSNVGVGQEAGKAVTTAQNVIAIGSQACAGVTTGTSNIGIGTSATASVVAGSSNIGVGSLALAFTTASNNVGIGSAALRDLTTGVGNTALGMNAGYSPTGSTTNKTILGSFNTYLGYQSGQNVTGQLNYATAVGYNATVGHHGSVAIGCDSGGTGAATVDQDEIALGTALHTNRVRGYLRIDRGQTTVGAAGAASALPATPTKYLSVKDSTGTEYVFPVYAKA